MNKPRPTITAIELTRRVNEDAKKMRDEIKEQGGHTTFNECKVEARLRLTDKYRIL